MNKRALELLVKALENPKLHKKNFNLHNWANGPHPPKKPTLECGSTACAIGLACTIPEWKKDGFKMVAEGDAYCPEYGPYASFDAVSRYLRITYEDVMYLFHEDSYLPEASPQDVANRIKEFINA